jgi:hypothetical protein
VVMLKRKSSNVRWKACQLGTALQSEIEALVKKVFLRGAPQFRKIDYA